MPELYLELSIKDFLKCYKSLNGGVKIIDLKGKLLISMNTPAVEHIRNLDFQAMCKNLDEDLYTYFSRLDWVRFVYVDVGAE